ncbi:MIP family channel proteins [Mycoplasmopsis californica]|uniref:Aquaporin n=1 Tax=Mycoplasmopsis equigenitalium TaxID=114883 RepID=A0ABY5J0B9_9BACT|nr:aquaporin [Mycoplasmopsis equigenitalium]UUD36710.1 aquaporin [Mycoplasmopsis equigenitalium]VEU69995.1 MIP family channel proteins [Mycoplasmopsis californica]
MFSFFKFKNRQDAKQPNSVVNWVKHLGSEFFGTIWLSFGLAGLSILIEGKTVEAHMVHNLLVAFFAGFIVVGFALMAFLRWSCDLNPAVTIYRWLNGTNNTSYALAKIATQFVAAIITGLIIYGIGNATNNGLAANEAISALGAANKDFIENNNDNLAAGASWIFFGEMVMTAVLLFPIFSPNVKDEYRDLIIMFVISLSVLFGMLLGSAAINPARGLAQQVPDLFFGIKGGSKAGIYTGGDFDLAKKDLVVATVMMMAGGAMAPVFYAFVQGVTMTYINPLVAKAIKFKNFKADELK